MIAASLVHATALVHLDRGANSHLGHVAGLVKEALPAHSFQPPMYGDKDTLFTCIFMELRDAILWQPLKRF